jgi:hypothetical protein
MPAQSPTAIAIALPQRFAETAPTERENTLSLNRIAASLQVLLASRRAARSEAHAYWYTVARGM